MNILANTTLIRVEQDAALLGAAMAAINGPASPAEVAEVGNMTRTLPLDSPITAAIYRGYARGFAGAQTVAA